MNNIHSRTPAVKVINCAEIAEKNWTFLKDRMGSLNITWDFHTATPKSRLERTVRRPNLARFRACLSTAWQAKSGKADFVVSHLPRTTTWVAIFCGILGVKARHLAFSFNFTELPTGKMKALMIYAFKQVDRFVVYSNAEKTLYAEYFHINESKIDVVKWAMDVPFVEDCKMPFEGKYVCAVGGEGRDYDLLLQIANELSEIDFVVVARPDNLLGRELPSNVHLYTNVPVNMYWGVVAKSEFVIIPLKTGTTNCGHITIVGSQLLMKPVVSTISSGTSDYLDNESNSLLSAASNFEAMRDNILRLWRDESLRKKLNKAILEKNNEYGVRNWVLYFEKYILNSIK